MIKKQYDPFQYMVENREMIIATLDESSTLKNAWKLLTKRLPEIVIITKFNTFKGYVRILKVIDGQISELTSENVSLTQELGKVRQEKMGLEERLGKVRQNNNDTEEELTKIKEELKSITNQQNVTAVLKNTAVQASSIHGKMDTVVDKFVALPGHEKRCVPKRVDGWGVQLRGQYYRMFKKINGKVKWIHIGRKWNTETAREKIRSFGG